MIKLSELFNIEYPKTLVFADMIADPNGINFVSSKGTNNGVVAKVQRNLDCTEYPANVITVPLKGTVMMASLQTEPCYVAHQVAVLSPKKNLSIEQLIYYCVCIRHNKYKYNHGRQADKTLKELLVPDLSEIPDFVDKAKLENIKLIEKFSEDTPIQIDVDSWKSFKYSDLFTIKKGKRVTKLDIIPGKTAFISAVDKNNGIREYCSLLAIHEGNTITVNYNGSVGEAFYQEEGFWASDDVNVLYPKFKLNKYIAMFLITIIRHEKFRFNYGRKWHKDRMEESIMKLPARLDGTPDFEFMEKYIKTLSYSSSI